MMIRYTLLLCLYSLVACGQQQNTKKKEQQHTNAMNITAQTELDLLQIPIENINADNIVETIAKQVQRYEIEPIYYLRIGKANCLIEILINDIPTYESFSLENLATPLEINHNILKSGVQTVTVRMYPVGDLIKEEYGYGDTVTTLGDASAVKISVIQADHRGNQGIDDEETVITHNSPTKDDTEEVFAGADLPLFEYTFTFEATVPYHIKNGWDTAIDLTKLDQKHVEQKTVDYYNNFLEQFEKKNANSIARLTYRQSLTEAQTYYKSTAEIQRAWDESIKLTTYSSIEAQLFNSGYKTLYCASGGGVFLQHKDPINQRLDRESMAWIRYEREGIRKAYFFGVYLYCPKKLYRKKKLVFQMM